MVTSPQKIIADDPEGLPALRDLFYGTLSPETGVPTSSQMFSEPT